MTLTLRGTALMYYGEEIGMPNLAPEELRDIPLGPKRKVADNRDPERSPMQWSAGKGGLYQRRSVVAGGALGRDGQCRQPAGR
jgi:glycosidase